ncbi:bifunctional serine/threonine-protein kinase/formylglycine-generating enzyme family protein [Lignipirellula cremea]|uniref:Serine/threonine-protein kinase PrkC n=1 Tax=Lignipirellula cremea TaxID=2528010 RepID=A0A518DYQ5_9BACT|nr:bifunctional serine/threonine-protein kinase/formylglycine-generating enzyme family protein [Lignipirellula cremea]QDU96935.1 Serine/threonine-protein kinase PrkC [Lignipirellula cremea]
MDPASEPLRLTAMGSEYQITQRLGGGGACEVFLAQADSGEQLAVKVLRPLFRSDERLLRRFAQEAKSLQQINHPNVVRVIKVNESETEPYILLEYVDGKSLDERMREPALLSHAEAVTVCCGCLEGLVCVHDTKIVHRDIKPANILLERSGRVVLSDFGLALEQESDVTQSISGGLVGTLAYMSPEQCAGRPVDHRSDLYSLGVVLFEMATGSLPFAATNPAALAYQTLHENPRWDLLDRAAPGLTPCVQKLMARDPSQRFQTASAALQALQSLTDVSQKPAAPTRRRTAWAVGGSFAVLAVLLASFFSAGFYNQRNPAPAAARDRDPQPLLVLPAPVPPQPRAPEAAPQKVSIVPLSREPAPRVTNSIGSNLVWIPPGKFTMGMTNPGRFKHDDWATPEHEVELTRGFYMATCEVTRAEFEEVMGVRHHLWGEDKTDGQRPASVLSWSDAVEFCRQLSNRSEEKKKGFVYRLPTEAEWEYACRAGQSTDYSWGDSLDGFEAYAWVAENSQNKAQDTGKLAPNPWGLYDMTGNMAEWCQDWFAPYPGESVVDPSGPPVAPLQPRRVMRGSSFNYEIKNGGHRSASRSHHDQDGFRSYIGFRVVADIPLDQSQPSVGL